MINARGFGLAALVAGVWFTVAAASQAPVLPAPAHVEPGPFVAPRRRRPPAPTVAALLSDSPLPGLLM